MGRFARTLVPLTGLVAGMLGPMPIARAATITPTVFSDDTLDNGNCTLREAIEAANANAVRDQCPAGTPEPDTIVLQAGAYTLSLPGTADDSSANGDLDILSSVNIVGQGPGQTIVDGNGAVTSERVFHIIGPPANATITDLTVQHGGNGNDGGAGIRVEILATLTLARAAVYDNDSGNSTGGGLAVDGTATVSETDFSYNTTNGDWGGGVFVTDPAGSLTIERSSIHHNSASDGGGVGSDGGILLSIVNTTISANTASDEGGGIYVASDSASLNNVTVTGNTADNDGNGSGDGGGTSLDGVAIESKNSIIAGNVDMSPTTKHPDCSPSGGLTSQGHNLIGDTTGCGFSPTTGDITGQNPMLGPLADNGGPTTTHALLKGSPAIDAGGTDCAPTDQRGLPRNCDIGAYELVLCQKVAVNRIGTEGADVLEGTAGPDGFLAQGGNDRVKALGGGDGACLGGGRDTAAGGGGKDRLSGEAGKDRLKGQGGADRLKGGPGKDTCLGGGGRDRGSCETEKRIP